MILPSWTAVHSLWSIISTNLMTPLRDHPVIHSALTNRHAALNKRSAGLWGIKRRSFWNVPLWHDTSHPSSVEEGENRKCRTEHVTFAHLRIFCSDFGSVCTENVFAIGKKNYSYGNTLKIGVGQEKKEFIFCFFSAYCNCPCQSIQRQIQYVCLSFWNGKDWKLFPFDKKWTVSVRPSASDGMLALFGIGMGKFGVSLADFVVILALGPWSRPVSSPVHLTTSFTEWIRLAPQTNLFTFLKFPVSLLLLSSNKAKPVYHPLLSTRL